MKNFPKTALAIAAAGLLASVSLPAVANHVPGASGTAVPFGVNPQAVGESQTSFQAVVTNFNYEATVSQTAGGVFAERGLATFSTFNNPFNTALPASTTGLNQGPGTTGYNLYATFDATGTVTPASGGGINGIFNAFAISFFVDRNRDTTTFGTVVGGSVGDDTLVATGRLLSGGFHVFPGLANGDFAVRLAGTPVGGFFNGISILDLTGVNTSITGVSAGAFSNGSIIGSGNVQAIPEPETYALFLAGLGALGWVARRRRVQ